MISIPATVKISLRALWVNKMRSSLTMLGIIIGVAAVIAMLAVGTGASRKIAQQVASVGSNLIIVVPGSTTQGGLRMMRTAVTVKPAECSSAAMALRSYGLPWWTSCWPVTQ